MAIEIHSENTRTFSIHSFERLRDISLYAVNVVTKFEWMDLCKIIFLRMQELGGRLKCLILFLEKPLIKIPFTVTQVHWWVIDVEQKYQKMNAI